MTDEEKTEEEPIFAEDENEEEERGSGPGFRRGLILGAIAGAVAATLFAPPTGEELYEASDAGHGPEAPGVDTQPGRVNSLLAQVRARVHLASEEAVVAAKEQEERIRARYAELTEEEPPAN